MTSLPPLTKAEQAALRAWADGAVNGVAYDVLRLLADVERLQGEFDRVRSLWKLDQRAAIRAAEQRDAARADVARLTAALAEARAEEREACAQICDRAYEENHAAALFAGDSPRAHALLSQRADEARALAKALRERGPGEGGGTDG